jgi:hypothetical protein
MKQVILLFCALIVSNLAIAQSEDIGIVRVYTMDGNSNWGQGYKVIRWVEPDDTSGLKVFDIITHVNGIHTQFMNEMEFQHLCEGSVGSIAHLTVLRMGILHPLTLEIPRTNSIPSEYVNIYRGTRYKKDKFVFGTVLDDTIIQPNNNDSPYQVETDKEVDFRKYNTFDFEFTNAEEPLTEKELASILQDILEQKGLHRDKENPDILIFLDFYIGEESQYIPPQQELRTRYDLNYNYLAGRFESRPHLETITRGGYTKTKYLAIVDITFLDAQKAKTSNENIKPIVWKGTYRQATAVEQKVINVAKREYLYLMRSYPIVMSQELVMNFDLGIDVAYDDYNKIVKIRPNSYAEMCGFPIGEIVSSRCFVDKWSKWGIYDDPELIETRYTFTAGNMITTISRIKLSVKDTKGKIKEYGNKQKPSLKKMTVYYPVK